MRLYCATTNAGKLREFRLAASDAIEVEPLPEMERIPPCEETGITFEENAIRKAVYYRQYCNGYLFADDSGLEVDALGGAPGVYSARFAGRDASAYQNNALLLEKLGTSAERTARFVCVIALTGVCEPIQTFRGEVEGLIVDVPRGSEGFGYDSVFYYPPFAATFAQVPIEQKQTVSHRSLAFKELLVFLRDGLV